jgi:toxin ParE1/3/4
MSHALRILPAAEVDIDAAAAYIARDNLKAALRFYDAVEHAYLELAEHPKRWPRYELDHPRLAKLRKRSVAGFKNYLIFYHTICDVVEIIRVLHGARDIPSLLADRPKED